MMFGFRDEFCYFQCSACHCLQIKDLPQNIAKYYPSNYYSFKNKNSDRNKTIENFLIKQRNAYALFGKNLIGRFLYNHFPETRIRALSNIGINFQSKILDVGCGSGGFIESLHDLGFTELFGIDPFSRTRTHNMKGFEIQKKEIQDVEGDEEWDLIMFHHSFEHLRNPLEILRKAFRLLAKSGTCIIGIPLVSSYAWERYKTDWVQLDAPRHFFLHSIDSLNILIRQSGFYLWKTIFDSTAFQFWGSEQYVRDIPLFDDHSFEVNPKKSPFSRSQISEFKKKARSLNLSERGDQALFFLKKP